MRFSVQYLKGRPERGSKADELYFALTDGTASPLQVRHARLLRMYEHVATVEASDEEHLFELLQNIDLPWPQLLKQKGIEHILTPGAFYRSMSVGDLILIFHEGDDGGWLEQRLCAPCGFINATVALDPSYIVDALIEASATS